MTKDRKKTPLQMIDIARMAGVSKSTVSRALSDSPLVNAETKDLILKLAREHNYRLNTAARNFRLKESLTIALLLPAAGDTQWSLSDPFFLELLSAIAEAVDEHGHQLLLSRITSQSGNWIRDFINSRTADGVILIGQGSEHEMINEITKQFRAVSVWGAKVDDDQNYPIVGSDNELGGYRATRHLIDEGRNKIAFIGYDELPEISLRHQGYQRALRESDIAIDEKLLRVARHSEDAGYYATKRLIEEKIPFDAIFSVSDLFAMAAIRALQEEGLKVPDDIAVVGYDNISVSAYYNPPLSSIHQNRILGGKILVDNLLVAMDGGKPGFITLDPELVVRKSSRRQA
ncbi:MAG: substrate-binding domain-containing protein [Exilibacterium sp.]